MNKVIFVGILVMLLSNIKTDMVSLELSRSFMRHNIMDHTDIIMEYMVITVIILLLHQLLLHHHLHLLQLHQLLPHHHLHLLQLHQLLLHPQIYQLLHHLLTYQTTQRRMETKLFIDTL